MTDKIDTVNKGVELAKVCFFKGQALPIDNALWPDVKKQLPSEVVLFFESKAKETQIMADEKKEQELKFQEIEGKLSTAQKALDEKTLAFQVLEKAVSEKDAKLKELGEKILAFQAKAEDDAWEARKKILPLGFCHKDKEAENRKLWKEEPHKFYDMVLAFKETQKQGSKPEGEEAPPPAGNAPEQNGIGNWNMITQKYE